MNNTHRNHNLDMLHLAASFFVIYGHEYNLLNQAAPVFLGNQIHALGLKLIFLISGYLIARSLFSMSGNKAKITISYVIKRLGRLFPEYFFCLVMAAFLIGPIFSLMGIKGYFNSFDAVIYYIRQNLLLYPVFYLPGVFANNPYAGAVNGSLWTMPVEVSMYILFLLIMLLSKNRRSQKIIYTIFSVVILILWTIKVAFFPNFSFIFYGTDWGSAISIIIYYIIGAGIYIWDLQNKFNIQISFFLVLILCVFKTNILFFQEIICILGLTCCVFSLGFTEKQYLNIKYLHPECAYGVYLWGFPVQQCIIQLFVVTEKIQSINFLFFISAVISYIFARISYNFIYKPFKKVNAKIMEYVESHL